MNGRLAAGDIALGAELSHGWDGGGLHTKEMHEFQLMGTNIIMN
jgi:hypothetical protein